SALGVRVPADLCRLSQPVGTVVEGAALPCLEGASLRCMVRDRAGGAACHRVLERPQAPVCLGSPTAPSQPTSSRYRSNTKSRIDLADAPLSDCIFALSAAHNAV